MQKPILSNNFPNLAAALSQYGANSSALGITCIVYFMCDHIAHIHLHFKPIKVSSCFPPLSFYKWHGYNNLYIILVLHSQCDSELCLLSHYPKEFPSYVTRGENILLQIPVCTSWTKQLIFFFLPSPSPSPSPLLSLMACCFSICTGITLFDNFENHFFIIYSSIMVIQVLLQPFLANELLSFGRKCYYYVLGVTLSLSWSAVFHFHCF